MRFMTYCFNCDTWIGVNVGFLCECVCTCMCGLSHETEQSQCEELD